MKKNALILLFCLVGWFYCLPWYVDLLVLLPLAIYLYRKPGWIHVVLVTASMVLGLLLLEGGLVFISRDRDVFYRHMEHVYADISGRIYTYRHNIDVTHRIPCGDLCSEVDIPRDILTPRAIRITTDNRGYRNDKDYHGQKTVLVGDSFVEGANNDQDDTITALLRREHGRDVYNEGFPMDIQDYLDISRDFLKGVNPDVNLLLFVFEGNDFIADMDKGAFFVPNFYDNLKLKMIKELGGHFVVFHFLYNTTRNIEKKLTAEKCFWRQAGQGKLAFYRWYVDTALASRLTPTINPGGLYPEVAERIGAVFFVPTKYRVYAPLLEGENPVPATPPPGVTALKEAFGPFGVPVVDLSPVMQKAAAEKLPQGKYLYWPDDTHWNAEGVRSVLPTILPYIR